MLRVRRFTRRKFRHDCQASGRRSEASRRLVRRLLQSGCPLTSSEVLSSCRNVLIRLSALVGKVNFSDTMSPNTIVQTSTLTPTVSGTVVEPSSARLPAASGKIYTDALYIIVAHVPQRCTCPLEVLLLLIRFRCNSFQHGQTARCRHACK